MKTRAPLFSLIVMLASTTIALHAAPTEVKGFVYNDLNANGKKDVGEPGIAKVGVSNGSDIVKTARDGSYRLPIQDGNIIFVIKPTNWALPLDRYNKPVFYYTYKPSGSPKLKYPTDGPTGALPDSVDFALRYKKEPSKFTAIVMGDPQITNIKEAHYLSRDIIAEIAGTKTAFTAMLGDIGHDKLEVYDYVVPIMAHVGNPLVYVRGNHDTNYDMYETGKYDKATWEHVFGPSYYSYEYGGVHFVVLDDMNLSTTVPHEYTGKLDDNQMKFLKADLESLPKNRLVVLFSHIPYGDMEEPNRLELFKLLENHPHQLSLSGHWHTQDFWLLDKAVGWTGSKPLLNMVLGTACGNWWNGAIDETGLPNARMEDGTPNGYSYVDFSGTQYKIRYKAARWPAEYQMQVAAPDDVAQSEAANAEILVNYFMGGDGAKLDMQIEGYGKTSLTRTCTIKGWKPNTEVITAAYKDWTGESNRHLWLGSLPANISKGYHTIKFTGTDYFGQQQHATQIININ